ncbi:hypothetical protein PN568_06890, partial [Parabacteroides merdae]
MTPKRYPIPNSPPERILQHIKQKKESGLRLTPPLRELSLSLLKNGGYLLSHFYAVPSTWLGLTSLFG